MPKDDEGGYETPRKRSAPVPSKPTSAPQPKQKGTASQKASSWGLPSAKPGKHLVGQIYFRTKDSAIDAGDRSVLAELARAYSGNKQTPVRGNFDGFADPRPSHEPDNAELSEARAGTVARELLHAFASTSAWYENISAIGRGVDPAARTVEAEEGFEDNSAPYRRVDVYLDGKANPEPYPQTQLPDTGPKAPTYPNGVTYWEDEYGDLIERGHKSTIEGVALRLIKQTGGKGSDGRLDEYLSWLGVRNISKPSWWDARIPAPVHGRGGFRHDQRPEYVRRAQQLVRDYQLFLNYLEARQGDLQTWTRAGLQEARRIPNGKEIEERLGHLRFMIGEIGDEAVEVLRLVQ